MVTDLSTLTTAADRWDGMAKEFNTQEKAYERDVHGITVGSTWIGASADTASMRFDVTLKEFQNAQVEAKAIASLLRNAHTQFVDLRGKLKSVQQDAVDAGMVVSDQGLVSYDTQKLSQGELNTLHHDPDYQHDVATKVRSWQELIDQLVKDAGDTDKDVQTALQAVVVDSNINDGTVTTGFNGQAQGDIVKYAHRKPVGTRIDDTVFDVGASVTTDPKYGKEGSAKAYADLFHVTADGALTSGDWKLAGIADSYGGARATANYGFNNKGAIGKIEGSAGIRALAEGRAEYGPYAGVYGRTEGFAGAEIGGNAKATKDEFTLGGKAFAGAKAGVTGGGEVAGIGFGATAEGWAGPGAEAWWGYKKGQDGKFHLGGKAGGSAILGGSVGFEITVDTDKLGKTVGDAADAVGDGIRSVGDDVIDWF
ncbi:hypothetical protein [Streptomyces scabiei]|uniref:hypothetical protein n=1 Tax=Streptomyces TaxID=1883 RepID=UPI0029A8B39B|nr:hypothetical protein [Streptomyces scabiei]MDX3116935.1 hypothetical protein [Streptomyces scabiei]